MAPRIFGDVDHVSSILLPYGATAQQGWRIFGISACTLSPDLRSLLLLCDRGAIFSATVEFHGLQLSNISFHHRTEITARDSQGMSITMDVEGMAIDNSTGEVLLSSEPSHFFRLPHWRQLVEPSSSLEVTWLPHQPSKLLQQNERRNEGLEAFTATAGNTFAAGLEGPLATDDSLVRRVLEVDQTGRLLWSGFMLVDNVPSPRLLLSEMAALENLPNRSGGRYFLGLERRWSAAMGNDIRLYLLNFAGASNVSNCSAICDGACSFQGDGAECYLQELTPIQKQLIFQWTPSQPLHGVVVENYEAMTLVPPQALGFKNQEELGGVAVLLVSDNNDNPRQIGTQFVLFRLPFAAMAKDGEGSDWLWWLVPVVLLAAVCLACLCTLPCRRRARRFVGARRFEDDDLEPAASGSGTFKLGRPADAV